MKRAGQLFGQVIEPTNLELAFWKASRGKRARDDQRAYAANLSDELARLRSGLIAGDYPIGAYRRFTIFEPKERVICAASFRERVLHHALMNVLEPWIEKWLVHDSYACRRGKGQLRAVYRAQEFARRYTWYMKCDFRKFFDSIPHEGLYEMLARRIKDRAVVARLEKIIATYETTPGRGLPIGNLTSQHLANLYLDPIDRLHHAHGETARVGKPVPRVEGFGYVRYMDDFVYWSDDKVSLLAFRDRLIGFAEKRLGLSLKQVPYIQRTERGMDFLGLRVYPNCIRASRASLARFRRKVRIYDHELACGRWSEREYQERMTALTAFLEEADTLAWRRDYFGRRREASGSNRVIRGGSWNNNAQNCRSAYRNNNNPSNNNNNNGFRLCCDSAALQPAPQESEGTAVPADDLPNAKALAKTTRPIAASSAPEARERRGGAFVERTGAGRPRTPRGETASQPLRGEVTAQPRLGENITRCHETAVYP